MSLPMDTAIPVPVHFDGHNINIISDNLPTPAPQPKVPAATNPNKDRQSLYKTELCREWSTSGWCYYGKRCSFAHGLNELRPVFRSKKWRTKRCRNWQSTGYCPYEHRCQFLHDQTPPRNMYEDGESDEDNSQGESRGKQQQQQQQQQQQRRRQETEAGESVAGATKTRRGGGSKTTKVDGIPTAGDGGNQLYFHFDVRPADAEEESEPATDDSENYMNGERPPSRRRRGGNNKQRGATIVLNDIGNREGDRQQSPPNSSILAAQQSGMKRRRRRGATTTTEAQSPQSPQSSPPVIVTQISPSPSPALEPVAASRPPPSFGYPNQHISQMEMMQAQQIMANQATANQLAAHLAAAHQHQQPFFENKTAAATSFAALQQQQLMAALQRMSSGGSSSIANVEGVTIPAMIHGGGGGGGLAGAAAPTMTAQQQHLMQQQQHQQQQQQQHQLQQQATMMGGRPSSPPPSVPIDWTGLAGGLPSIPMSQGDTNAALLNAMYTMGPSLTELYYAARLNQMPTAELEQLCMGLYPATAPVPFASTPMTASGPLTGLAGASTQNPSSNGLAGGPMSGVTSVRPNNGGLAGAGGGNGGNMVFDPSGLHTPSGSVEPPGFDSAFYPTPSPPPSSFGGLDSVSNLNGIRFVPNDPSGATSAAYGLAYAAAQSQAGAGGPSPMTPAHFLLPHCSTPVPLASPPPPQMTPTGMYGGFPQFFGGPAIAGAAPQQQQQHQQKSWGDASAAAMNAAAAASGLSSPNPDGMDPNSNGIAFVSGNPNFVRSAGRA